MKVFNICRAWLLWCTVSTLMALFLLLSCKNDAETHSGQLHDPSKPVVVTTFSPTEGGAKDKILLNGENFGTDASRIEVYFNNKKAAVVSSSGNRIYAIVPACRAINR